MADQTESVLRVDGAPRVAQCSGESVKLRLLLLRPRLRSTGYFSRLFSSSPGSCE